MRIKKILRTYFVFSRKERNAAVLLSLLLAFLLFIPVLQRRYFIQDVPVNYDSLSLVFALQKNTLLTDSTENYFTDEHRYFSASSEKEKRQQQEFQNAIKIIPPDKKFSADTINAAQWIAWGISPAVSARIENYLQKGGRIDSGDDLKKIYGITETEIGTLEPWLQPSAKVKNDPFINDKKGVVDFHPASIIDINVVDEKYLTESGIPISAARKIISARDELGGFCSLQQLNKIYGVDSVLLAELRTYVTINEKVIKKINLNTASFEQLAKHTYISDALAHAIIDYRNATGRFASVSEILNVPGMYDRLFEKLKPYLTI